MACASTLAERGHDVTLIDGAQRNRRSVQLRKAQFPARKNSTRRCAISASALIDTGVRMRLGEIADAASIKAAGFEDVIIATGITPRKISFPGSNDARVLSYLDILAHNTLVGQPRGHHWRRRYWF